MNEPAAPDPVWPRYSDGPFPRYRFVPGRSPHPRRDPAGHSFGTPEPKPPPLDPSRWPDSPLYLRGVDLYNFAYWWECHEAFEALWHAVGHDTPPGRHLQGLIQVAAANLKRFLGDEATARTLAEKGLARHAGLPAIYLGVELEAFARNSRAWFGGRSPCPALIRLTFPAS